MATPEIKSVGKAFALLECLAAGDDCVSLPSMAKRCGMTVATAHRLLATMEALGAVVHTGPGEYSIGLRLVELSRRSSLEALLASATMPMLSRVNRLTGLTAHVAVLDAEYMVTYVGRSAGRSARIATHPGNKLEAYCSALGKVLLAGLSEQGRDAYLAEGPFPALTGRTISCPQALAGELAQVREQNFAIDDCEMFDDLRCVGVPVIDPAGQVVAALSASGSTGEVPPARVPALVAELTHHASVISRKLFPRAATPAISH